jgi:hypothetical protein
MRKFLGHGADGFTSPPKEGVLRIFISLIYPSHSAVIDPRTLGPMESTLTITPLRRPLVSYFDVYLDLWAEYYTLLCNYYRPCRYKYYWTAVKPEERGDMFLRNVGCLRRRIPEDNGISKLSPSWNKKLVRLQIEITCRPCRLQSWRSKTQTKFLDVNYRSAYNLSSSCFLPRSVDVRIPKFNFTFFCGTSCLTSVLLHPVAVRLHYTQQYRHSEQCLLH